MKTFNSKRPLTENFHPFLLSDDFSKSTFQNILSEIPAECQIVCINIRSDVLSGIYGSKMFAKVISRRH